MEMRQIFSLFGSAKQLGNAITRDYASIYRWREKGIPLTVATAIEGALRARAERCVKAADAIGLAVLKAKSESRNKIKEF